MKVIPGGITIDRKVNPSGVQQHMKNQTDINEIMRKAKEGVMPTSSRIPPMYEDVSEVPDYQTALRIVEEGNDAFMAMPAKTRKVFGNDVVTFMRALQDPSSVEMLVEAGILKREVKEPPEEVKQVPPVDGGATPQQ